MRAWAYPDIRGICCCIGVPCVRFAFVTGEDLCSSFDGDTLFTVQAPTGTHLELPTPDAWVLILCERYFSVLFAFQVCQSVIVVIVSLRWYDSFCF